MMSNNFNFYLVFLFSKHTLAAFKTRIFYLKNALKAASISGVSPFWALQHTHVRIPGPPFLTLHSDRLPYLNFTHTFLMPKIRIFKT